MGVLLMQRAGAALAIVLIVGGCSVPSFRMRMATPAGAELRVLRGPFSEERTLPLPFVATFQPMGSRQHYAVSLRVPAALATALGARGEVVLPGELHVYRVTEVARHTTAELPVDEDRLGRLVRGEIAEASWWVSDPNVVEGQLAHLRLHAPAR